MSGSPGVVLLSRFVMPGAKGYGDYVEYMNRDDVKLDVKLGEENKNGNDNVPEFDVFYSYIDYVGDEEKDGELFTESKDVLNEEDMKVLKEQFSVAQENGSPLWQDVISFDNDWLAENGLYNSRTGQVDEAKLRSVVRGSTKELLLAEGMGSSAVYAAGIHYNTENIHVHIAIVEPEPTRKKARVFNHELGEWEDQYRGKRKQGSLDKMKSKVVNMIVDRSKQRNRMDDIIRGAVADKRDEQVKVGGLNRMGRLFLKALDEMPEDRRQWMYGYQSVDNARPYIDEIVEIYLETNHKEEMKELVQLLDEEVEVMKLMYGENSNYKRYKDTKLDDLKKRMGNAVITEMRNYQKIKDAEGFQRVRKVQFQTLQQARWKQQGTLGKAMRELNYRMKKNHHDFQLERNMAEFDRMMDGYDR